MPELPEVQTIVDDLNSKIKGWTIADFWTDWEKAIKTDLDKFKKSIIGKKLERVDRRGKNLLFLLSDGLIMHIHLKMTGHILVKSEKLKAKSFFKERVNQYIHHIWHLKKGGKKLTLEFSDLRKFGKIRLIESGNLGSDKELSLLGVEPLSAQFTLKNFEKILDLKKINTIRDILLNQALIAGIGNIYASEILFEAGVLPLRKSSELKADEIRRIFKAIQKILKKAVRLRGTSDSDYRDTFGAPGSFQKLLNVYNREKKTCKRNGCEGIIRREKIKQRSAFYCGKCQA